MNRSTKGALGTISERAKEITSPGCEKSEASGWVSTSPEGTAMQGT